MDVVDVKTEVARALMSRLRPGTWEARVLAAKERAETLESIWADAREGKSLRQCVRERAPSWSWSQYQHMRRRTDGVEGPSWEHLLDLRFPPPPRSVSQEVRTAAEMLRSVDRSMNCEVARSHLVGRYGARASVSDTTLRRIWRGAGLTWQAPDQAEAQAGAEEEAEVKTYGGGGGLALLAAAEAETQAFAGMASVVAAAKGRAPEAPAEPYAPAQGNRDDHGRFAAGYNEQYRKAVAAGKPDSRWDSDGQKRQRRDVGAMQLWKFRPHTIASRAMSIGLLPLLTQCRGFDGLSSPLGSWLGVLGIHPYAAATVDKTLAELALADVEDALWTQYGRTWFHLSRPWCEAGAAWLQLVAYVDSTQDPYWTARFAQSGPVSRTGRVGPCLSRVVVTSGPGVPIVVETVAGVAVLKKRLIRLLNKLDEVLGEGEIGRITVIDAEMAVVGILDALALHDRRGFVTVIKGQTLRGATLTERSPWQGYRQKDELREMDVVLKGSELARHGLVLRGVQMRRTHSRNPVVTTFVTDLPDEALPTDEVADAYLSRWPHQEQLFRNARNGGGLNHSHGYGGIEVQNVALQTKKEQARRRLARASKQIEKTEQALDAPALPLSAQVPLRQAMRASKRTEKQAERDLARYDTYPETIYQRDTTRESIVTSLTMTGLMLVMFVLHEYLGGLRMQFRTFIEQLMPLPVTVVTTQTLVRYQIHANSRNPALMARLREACTRINTRDLHRGDCLLRYELLEDPPPA